ncbi:hypothetical protein BACI9J_380001 [Bacillus altitudinis]|nr:hypothetical protein BACI9J_380001 [Bacillus altitudinis]
MGRVRRTRSRRLGEVPGAVGVAAVRRGRVRRPRGRVDDRAAGVEQPRGVRLAESEAERRLVEDGEAPGRDGRTRGDRVRVVVVAVAQHVPAQVDGGAAGVGQLHPVAGGAVLRLDLVDPHG